MSDSVQTKKQCLRNSREQRYCTACTTACTTYLTKLGTHSLHLLENSDPLFLTSLGAGSLLNRAAGCSHYLHTTATADWAFSFEQFPHKSAFCSTLPPAYFRAMLLTRLCQPSSFLCWFTQPVANSQFVWTHSLQAKLSAKCSFPSAEQGKASEEPSPDARGLAACRDMTPPPDPAVPGRALLQCLTQLPPLPRCRAGPDEQTHRLWKDYVV